MRCWGSLVLVAAKVVWQQSPTPTCGMLCQARPHPVPSSEMGPKANAYRTKGQWYPGAYAYRLVLYHGVWLPRTARSPYVTDTARRCHCG